ncbi:hypothetical protein GCM10027174_25460 [Salinifilum aidingensis]
MTQRRVASEAQVAMQHRYRCPRGHVIRVDALPPGSTDLVRQRYWCDSCGLYLTGTQLTDEERNP